MHSTAFEKMATTVDEFNEQRAREAVEIFRHVYNHKITTEGAGRLWSSLPFCFDTTYLTKMLVNKGLDAQNIYNSDAYSQEVSVSKGIIRSTLARGHLVCRVAVGFERYYIDPYWQQFPLLVASTSPDELFREHTDIEMPPDRAIIYREDQMQDVSDLFAITARLMQERIIHRSRHLVSDACSRQFTVVDIMLNTGLLPPLKMTPYVDLDDVAQRIWHPERYTPISDDEIAKLQPDDENGSRLP